MSDANLRYRVNIDGEAGVTAGFRKVADSIDGAEKSMGKAGKGADRLSAQMAETKTKVRQLREEFNRTGDTSLLKEISKGERDLKRLSGWMQHLGNDSDDSSKKVGSLSVAVRNVGTATSSLSATLGGGLSNPYVAIAAGAAIAEGAVFGLAAASGAALAGIGVGFVGLGAVGVRNSQRVQGALEDLGETADRTLTGAARVMEGPFVDAINTVRGAVAGVGPALSREFALVAPHVDNLADGVAGLVQNMVGGGGLEHALEAAGPVLDMLGDKLPELGASFDDFFQSLGDSGPGAMKALAGALDLLNIAVKGVGNTLEGASRVFDALEKIPGNSELMNFVHGLAAAAGVSLDLGDKMDKTTAAARDELTAFVNLTNAMRAQTQVALGLSGSQDAITKGFQKFSDAVKENGTAVQGNTAKAIANRTAIRDSLGDIQQHGDMMLKDGANIGQVTMKRDADLRKLRDVLVARGYDRKAVEDFIATTMRVPKSVFTQVALSGDAAARQRLASVAAAAASIQRAIHLTVGISGTSAAYATLNQLSARARAGVGGNAAGGPIGHFAGGGFSGRVLGAGTATSDSIPAMLSNGEYVIKAPSVKKAGVPAMDFLNRTGTMPVAGGGGAQVINLTINVTAPAGTQHPAEFGSIVAKALQDWCQRNGSLRLKGGVTAIR